MPASAEFKKRQLFRPVYLPTLLFNSASAALLPVLPMSVTAAGGNLPLAGAITALALLGGLLAELPAGWLTTRIGERRTILIGMVGAGLAAGIPFFSSNLVVIGLSALCFGALSALVGLATHALVAHLVPADSRSRAMSIFGGMLRGSLILGPLFSSATISAFGLPSAYLVAGVMAMVGAIAIWTVPAARMSTHPSGQLGNIWQVAKTHRERLLTLGMASAIISAARTIRAIGVPLLAIHLGLSPEVSTLVIGLTAVLDFSLFYVGGIISDRFGRVWASAPTLISLGTLYVLSFLVTDLTGFVIFGLLSALSNALSSGINMTLGADMAPKGGRAEFLAAYRLLGSVVVTIAPFGLAALTGPLGLAGALAVTGLVNYYGGYLFIKHLPALQSEQRITH